MVEELCPDYPIVEGAYRLTPLWVISLPQKFNRREEGGDVVLWRPGFRMSITNRDNPSGQSKTARLQQILNEVSQQAFDLTQEDRGGVSRLAYRVHAHADGARVAAFYGFAVSDSGQARIAMYFDEEEDVEIARHLWRSLTPATPLAA